LVIVRVLLVEENFVVRSYRAFFEFGVFEPDVTLCLCVAHLILWLSLMVIINEGCLLLGNFYNEGNYNKKGLFYDGKNDD
jgi:hypothetical protein